MVLLSDGMGLESSAGMRRNQDGCVVEPIGKLWDHKHNSTEDVAVVSNNRFALASIERSRR